MEKDFHYFFIYAVAKLTGYDNAEIIAYSSQFVDDNNEKKFSIDEQKESFPERVKTENGYFHPIMTQSLSRKSLNAYVQKYVYVPFHFLPGDNNIILNEERNPLSTTPNSLNAKIMLKKAFNSKNPYQIGIGLHTFADTWSHQNFSGIREDWNSVYPWYKVSKSIVPNIGHAEAGHSPDVISETWTDFRFEKQIENKNRAFEAIAEIYKTLRKKTGNGPLWGDIKNDFRKIINIKNYDERIKAVVDLLSENKKGAIPRYDKNRWIDDALDIDKEITTKENFYQSHWHNFHQSAKRHFAIVFDLIKQL